MSENFMENISFSRRRYFKFVVLRNEAAKNLGILLEFFRNNYIHIDCIVWKILCNILSLNIELNAPIKMYSQVVLRDNESCLCIILRYAGCI